ncbi:MAG: suppressor of fused domain protein [Elusimicrobiaceae bacterium]|nr:suppressor of fused domain protein [Elusimicrobiaceae bacterium]
MEPLKRICRDVVDVFQGKKPAVHRYWDDKNVKHIDILSCEDSPTQGIVSYATLGLSQIDFGWTSQQKSLRTELIGTCCSETTYFPQILSAAAFEIMNSGAGVPGAVLRNIISLYVPETTTPHLFLTMPSMWQKELLPISFDDIMVDFLMVVPISDTEWRFLNQQGEEALESLLEEKQVHIHDFFRKPIG